MGRCGIKSLLTNKCGLENCIPADVPTLDTLTIWLWILQWQCVCFCVSLFVNTSLYRFMWMRTWRGRMQYCRKNHDVSTTSNIEVKLLSANPKITSERFPAVKMERRRECIHCNVGHCKTWCFAWTMCCCPKIKRSNAWCQLVFIYSILLYGGLWDDTTL